MNRRTLYILAVLLVLGAGAIAVIKSQRGAGTDEAQTGAGGKAGTPAAGGSSPGTVAAEDNRAARSSRTDRYPELTERYGAARTGLSRQVAGNVVTLLEEAISMGEMMQDAGRQGNWGGGGRWMSRAVASRTGVELKEEQQEAMMELYRNYRTREMDKAKVAVGALKKDPAALMELFLAGDARKREEMSDSEYEAVVASASSDLGDVFNPLDRNNFRGGNPMADDVFRRDFEALLDEEQMTAYSEAQAAKEAEAAAEGAPGDAREAGTSNITELPTMELEALDQAVGSARQIAGGLKQMMQGMGGLQQLQPESEGGDGGE